MIAAEIKRHFLQSLPFNDLCRRLEIGREVNVCGAAGSASVFILAGLYEKTSAPILVVAPSENEAKQLFEDLEELLPPETVHYFPPLKHHAWSEIGPSRIDVGRRVAAVKRLRRAAAVVITTVEAVFEKLADPEDVELYSLSLKAGDTVSFAPFVLQLAEMGFCREERVEAPGEFSVRGGIVDVYPFDEEAPLRFDFFGDQIESIRRFDVESQRSTAELLEVEILPPAGAGVYAPLIDMEASPLRLMQSIAELFPPNAVFWLNEPEMIAKAAEDWDMVLKSRFEGEKETETPQTRDSHFDLEDVKNRLSSRRTVKATAAQSQPDAVAFPVSRPLHFGGNLKLFRSEIDGLSHRAKPRVFLAADSDDQAERLRDLFEEEHFPPFIHISTLNISAGLLWPDSNLFLYTARELYSRVRMSKLDLLERRSVALSEASAFRNGDYVVHQDYGIGIFRGLEKIKAYGRITECLTIEYQDGDKVFVPLEKMDQVQKYSGQDGAAPMISKLGSGAWERLKERTKRWVKEIAADLIRFYAERKLQKGYAFSEDTVWQKELEASFEFEETIDQLAAIRDVKADMCAPVPMERLVCGDVGYGKTEVAVRAAFKAIMDGKQAAVLAPTTILAQQHYETFCRRMSGFPIKIDLLSRFKSPKQQKETLEALAAGKIDLIIGTHRLLSSDVKFKDLGLLVVDEEQRFGVLHKEKIRMMKKSVDTLLMSATPIPRTLHMAIMGAKDISVINSPPHNRLPVKTEVTRFNPDLIREAILRELDRGGQVFFVHNRIQSIYGIAARLRDLVPEAKIAVAHGQMKPHELEEVMLKFISGDVNVLVSTMIIENGIDMPKANTLFVNRADKFGLAQLYQLRGRVGRSNQQAYAYLIVPPLSKLTHDAVKRLQTIQEYTALGSGFKIAMRDLEIRGAGNIFGAEQTGFVNALGYELYTRIINEAVKEIRQELEAKPVVEKSAPSVDTVVECPADAYLPEEYISSAAERVDIYRRLVAADLDEIEDIKREVIDRFGRMPQKAEQLFNYLSVKRLASQLKFSKVILKNNLIIGEIAYSHVPGGEEKAVWMKKLADAAEGLTMRDHKERRTLVVELKLPGESNNLEEAKKHLQKML